MMFAYLNASFSNDDDSLEVPGYNLFRADHPSNTKRGGVRYSLFTIVHQF